MIDRELKSKSNSHCFCLFACLCELIHKILKPFKSLLFVGHIKMRHVNFLVLIVNTKILFRPFETFSSRYPALFQQVQGGFGVKELEFQDG